MSFSIDYNSATRVGNKLRRFARRNPQTVDKRMRAHAQFIRRTLKSTKYPPMMINPPQKYTRTGKLANSWRVQRVRAGRYKVVNSANYAPYVVDKKQQAWMHKNPYRSKRGSRPWWIAQDEAAKYNRALTSGLTSDIMADYR